MNCVQVDHQRVLRNRHADQCTGDCQGCLPCPEPHCTTCNREHAQVTCPGCLAMARHNLANVQELTSHLGAQARHGRQAFHTHNHVPGGDALVLLAPGSHRDAQRGQLLHRTTLDLDTSHTLDEQRDDPRPPLAVLVHWEARWRAQRGQQHPEGPPPTVEEVCTYLASQLHLIAATRLFTPLAQALARTVLHLEDVLYDGDRPDTSRVPCWECGTRLVKVYTDKETTDFWRCPRCLERYDRGRYERAKHDHLASTGADRYVVVTDAAAAIGRSEQTVRAWVRKGVVEARRDPISGRLVAWWPDIRAMHLAASTRQRGKDTPR